MPSPLTPGTQVRLLKAEAIEQIRDDLETAVMLAALAAGAPIVTALTSPVPADGTVELLKLDAGLQVHEVVAGAWVLRGWLVGPKFDTVALLLASTATTLGPDGQIVEGGGFRYQVAASAATDHHVITAGGVKLYVLPGDRGFVDVAFGAFGEEGVDDLIALQTMVDAGASIRRPVRITRKHQISPPGLAARSYSELVFEDAAKLELLPHSTDSYQIIRLYYVRDVTLINPRVDGRRDLNSATSGEFGHGIGLRGTDGKIRIINPVTNNCWGDGIYLGDGRGDPVDLEGWPVANQDVYIKNHFADNNRRQGMSIISVKRLVVDDPVWQNTNGANPEAGCDIEPNNVNDELEFVRINRPKTANNSGAGILVFVRRMQSKRIDIQINNHQDIGSQNGARVERRNGNTTVVTGSVVFNDPVWLDSAGVNFRARAWAAEGPKCVLNRPIGINANSSGDDPTVNVNFRSSFVVERQSQDEDEYDIGNVSICQPTVLAPDTTPSRPFWVVDSANRPIRNVDIIDPLEVSGGFHRIDCRYSSVGGVVSDVREAWRHDFSGSTTIDGAWARVAGSTRTSLAVWTLPEGVAGEPPLTMVNVGHAGGASGLRIDPPAGGQFLGQAVDAYYQCHPSKGHRMTVTPLGDGVWRVDELIGEWTLGP